MNKIIFTMLLIPLTLICKGGDGDNKKTLFFDTLINDSISITLKTDSLQRDATYLDSFPNLINMKTNFIYGDVYYMIWKKESNSVTWISLHYISNLLAGKNNSMAISSYVVDLDAKRCFLAKYYKPIVIASLPKDNTILIHSNNWRSIGHVEELDVEHDYQPLYSLNIHVFLQIPSKTKLGDIRGFIPYKKGEGYLIDKMIDLTIYEYNIYTISNQELYNIRYLIE